MKGEGHNQLHQMREEIFAALRQNFYTSDWKYMIINSLTTLSRFYTDNEGSELCRLKHADLLHHPGLTRKKSTLR